MRSLWEKMHELDAKLPTTEAIIWKKVKSKKHHFYVFYNRVTKECHFAVELVESSKPDVVLPKCKGFQLGWKTIPFIKGARYALTITCREENNFSFFLRITEDLKSILEDINEEKKMVGTAIRRISLWQEFFLKHGDKNFSVAKQKGLYGELITIERLNDKLWLPEIISAWVGPLKNVQDFQFSTCNIETKVTSNSLIRIHGNKQLSTNNQRNLYLHIIKINPSEVNGETVIEVVERLASKMPKDSLILEKFHEKLFSYGYPMGGFDNPIRLEIEKENFYEVKKGFPKYPEIGGIPHVEYDVDLAFVEEFKVEKKQILTTLKNQPNKQQPKRA
ncbi:PD-(D/E)XK motif protein [Mesobacillus subterraneus]|uniref:PD-(D/E)XK motif protein n=1 Tax=Mesobacillus subterraneus TaxID=285983 RepID=UPI001CFD59C8|nr:PD-(D/E)XK motif protein [Mesobacillus subterraneus]WLR55938.1 PD-(D/E)XK motif protein [Mesobacillus subterraneus]